MKKHKNEKNIVNKFIQSIKKHTSNSRAKDIFSEVIDLPNSIVSNSTRITTLGNQNVLIEKYVSIVDYFNHYIKIKCKDMNLIIEGNKLNIQEINTDDLVIEGEIFSICFKK